MGDYAGHPEASHQVLWGPECSRCFLPCKSSVRNYLFKVGCS